MVDRRIVEANQRSAAVEISAADYWLSATEREEYCIKIENGSANLQFGSGRVTHVAKLLKICIERRRQKCGDRSFWKSWRNSKT